MSMLDDLQRAQLDIKRLEKEVADIKAQLAKLPLRLAHGSGGGGIRWSEYTGP